jgi:hypothetical protein
VTDTQGDTAVSDALSDELARKPGIAFDRVEIHFIYSFLCHVPDFDALSDYVQKGEFGNTSTSKQHGAPRHVALERSKVHDFFRKNQPESDKYYWSVGTHPERLGIAPVLRFGSTSEGSTPTTEIGSDVFCWVRHSGPFEIRSDLHEKSFESVKIPSSSLAVLVDNYEALFRLGRSGSGTVTFKFVLDAAKFTEVFPADALKRLTALYQHLGMLPFIFTVLTLGRTEATNSRNGAPSSKLRRCDGSVVRFLTLQELFSRFLYEDVFSILAPSTETPSKTRSDPKRFLTSMDRNLVAAAQNPSENHSSLWQSPYVCVIADLDKEGTVLSRTDMDGHAWWYLNYSRDLYDPKQSFPQTSKGSLNVWRCYKETILLLLRLYQWRDILSIEDCLAQLDRGDSTDRKPLPIPHWRRVLVLPDLLEDTHFGHVFSDVDMVWDTRYLLLYHERSTLVLNYVGLPKQIDGPKKLEFRELFVQSLLHTLEHIRAQWHSAVVLNASLDQLVSRFQGEGSNQDPKAFRAIADKREIYARILRDPLIPGVESASLSVVRRRAHLDFEIPYLFQSLRDKFYAIDRFIADQAAVRNLEYLEKRTEQATEREGIR